MFNCSQLTMRYFACFACFLLAQFCSAQSGQASEIVGASLARLSTPKYPIEARVRGVAGDVEVQLAIRPDGNIASATVVSGPSALEDAALESAQHSNFLCHNCTTNALYRITYNFRLKDDYDPCCCSKSMDSEEVIKTPEGVTITTTVPHCICPDACAVADAEAHSRYRSWKCLYLWKCGRRRIMLL